ncbi:hypothetical protein U1872_17570 [Sphingomonas sp. RB3P16]|uniref:hypothetical protein n=1 Tax=Parasphingomonas frigoris TaxID=3096163 RepID=UPI002FC6F3CF
MTARGAMLLALLFAGCSAPPPPPASVSFGGLPVSGSLADAKRAGFIDCVSPNWGSQRCRRHGVYLAGAGPYEAAVDLPDGGGFDELTLWHDGDQYAVYKITDVLDRTGWRNCSTGDGERGDQIIYTKPGVAVRVSMDLSYWGKRRLRLLPASNRKEKRC